LRKQATRTSQFSLLKLVTQTWQVVTTLIASSQTMFLQHMKMKKRK